MEQLSIPQMNSEPEEPSKRRIVPFCFAIFLTLCVYLLWTSVFHTYTLQFWIMTALLYCATFAAAMLLGAKPNLCACICLICGVIFSMYAWINGLSFVPVFLYANAMVIVYAFFVLSLFGNRGKGVRTGTFLLNVIRSVFIYPFISFTAYFCSLFRWNKRSKRIGKTVLFVLIGVAAALVLGLIAIALLSFDPRFEALIRIDFTVEDVPEAILKIMLSVPVAAILFSAFTSAKEKKLSGFAAEERANAVGSRVKVVPSVVFLIPAVTLLGIYGLFFFSQWGFYMGAFSGVLPAEYTAAEYARSGFFELCAVAAINALLCASFTVFARRSGETLKVVQKIANTLLAIATLILIATALSKLVLYIRRFDLTYLRFLVAVVLIVFAIGFVMLILSQWIRRVQIVPVLTVCIAVMLLAAPFCNIRGRIAAYNVDRYLERVGQSEEDNRIDVRYLIDELGDAAVPETIRLLESGRLSEKDEAYLYRRLEDKHYALNELEDARHTLASRRALNALNVFFGEPEQ